MPEDPVSILFPRKFVPSLSHSKRLTLHTPTSLPRLLLCSLRGSERLVGHALAVAWSRVVSFCRLVESPVRSSLSAVQAWPVPLYAPRIQRLRIAIRRFHVTSILHDPILCRRSYVGTTLSRIVRTQERPFRRMADPAI